MISQRYLDLCDVIAHEASLKSFRARAALDNLKATWEYTAKEVTGTLPIHGKEVSEDWLYSGMFRLASWGMLQIHFMTGKDLAQIRDELKDTHARKNAGYSGNDPDPWRNFREVEKFGISAVTGCLTRLCDKYMRFQNVYKNPELDKVNESALDTMIDFVAYCIILICLLEETP